MIRLGLILCLVAAGAAAQLKSLPNQAGNGRLSLSGTAITDPKAVTSLLGADLGEGWIVVKIKATPQTPNPLRLTIDDFTLVSRKNGEKSGAMSPNAIAGSGRMIVTGASSRGSGVGATNGMGMPFPTAGPRVTGVGTGGSTEGGMADARIERSMGPEDPRLVLLEAKVF